MIRTEQLVEQLTNAARGCSRADLSALLDRSCGDSTELRHLVEERLLAEGLGDKSTLDWANPAVPPARSPQSARPDQLDNGRFRPGQVIAARFKVIRYIARGGMGEVYEVEDRFLQGVHVALKMILPGIASDANSARRFEQEVLLARKVTHPNLCPIYDIARSDDPPPPFLFLTMKLLTGETLSSRLRRPDPIARQEGTTISRHMVAGLAAIHAAGVIHRDIKPNNVMLDYSGPELCLSIMDFGLARLHEQDETIATHSLLAGTPGYMAPEVLQGQGPSQAADVFALGVLLHQVLTRERPGIGAVSLSVEPVPALDSADAPAALIRAVKEFLSNDPNRRCIAFEQIQTASTSDRWLDDWEPTSPATSSPKLLSRRHFVIGSVFAAAVVAGGAEWKWDWFYDLVHPLPAKRFVALMAWPVAQNESTSIVSTVLGSIHNRLARAEAHVSNLMIIFSGDSPSNSKTPVTPADSVSAWGANLVLAASLEETTSKVTLLLQILDAETQHVLRSHHISSSRAELSSLAEKGSLAATKLLGLPDRQGNADDSDDLNSISASAFSLFSQAEQLASQPNNTGLDEAILKYGECLNQAPNFRLGYAKLAIAYTRKYQLFRDTAILRLAAQNAEKAADSNSTSVMGLLSRALVYLYSGDTNNAMSYFSKGLKVDPGNPEILLYRGEALQDLNRWPDAEQVYRQILKERPNYWPANNALGYTLFRQAKYQQAADAYDAAAIAAPNVAMPMANLALMYAVLGKHDQAVDAAEQSLKRGQNEQAYLVLGDLAFSDGNYKGALADYQQARILAPNGSRAPLTWRNIGDCYAMLGQPALVRESYTKAANLLSEALKDNPRNGRSWMNLAFYHAKIGDKDAAESDIANAERRGANDVESQFMKVQTLALLGKKEEAITLLLACMDRGLSPLEVSLALDLKDIRKDPRYLSRIAAKHSATGPAAT